jgi:hypothetical protein
MFPPSELTRRNVTAALFGRRKRVNVCLECDSEMDARRRGAGALFFMGCVSIFLVFILLIAAIASKR